MNVVGIAFPFRKQNMKKLLLRILENEYLFSMNAIPKICVMAFTSHSHTLQTTTKESGNKTFGIYVIFVFFMVNGFFSHHMSEYYYYFQ